jgi:hypothetical protein
VFNGGFRGVFTLQKFSVHHVSEKTTHQLRNRDKGSIHSRTAGTNHGAELRTRGRFNLFQLVSLQMQRADE